MVKWQVFPGTADEWNQNLKKHKYFSFYQSYEWGEIKKQDGWQVLRVYAELPETPVFAQAQLLLKPLPVKGGFFWCPGGIMSALEIPADELKKMAQLRYFYFRCSFHDPGISEDELLKLGWEKPSFFLNSNLSMELSLLPDEAALLKNMSSNWRHNLKRFGKAGVRMEIWENPSAQEIFDSYQKFEAMKGLKVQHSFDSLQGVISKFHDQLVIYRAWNERNELLALRGYLYMGKNALDWYAISTQEGRSCYASHGVLWEVLKDAKARGVERYDLSGVDPVNNSGVYNFKKGTGAHEVRYPGEFEKASLPFLAFAMNKMMKRKWG